MKKKLVYVFGILLVLVLVTFFGLNTWVSFYLKGTINSKTERKYDILYDNLSINIFQSKIELKNLEIKPLNAKVKGTVISGSVKRADIKGYSIWDFITARQLLISELSLLNPEFRITQNDTVSNHSTSSKPFQSLFGDIVSRGKISNFSIIDGKAEYFVQGDSIFRIGGFKEFNLHASGLETDSVMLGHAIPFQVENISSSFKNLNYQIDADQNLKLDSFEFDFKTGDLELKDLSLNFSKPWKEIAKTKPFQQDIIDFHIGSLSISKLNPLSRLYDSLFIVAGSIVIDSLVLNDGRDKNISRPKDEVKKDFTALLKALKFPLEVDSLVIQNSKITYSEIEDGKDKPGVLILDGLNGLVLNLTSIDSIERKLPLSIAIQAKLNGKGNLDLKLVENYNSKTFKADLSLGSMDMTELNPTINNLAGIAIGGGQLIQLSLEMEAGPNSSDNHFLVEYKDLKMELLADANEKKGFLSSIANLAIHSENLPENKHYKSPYYATARNIYRGPINLIWLSIKDGLMATIPTKMVQNLLPHSKIRQQSKRELRQEKRMEKKGN